MLDAPATAVRCGVAAFVRDDATRAALSRTAAANGWTDAWIDDGGPEDAARALAEIPTPRLIVVDLAGCADPVAAIDALALVCDPQARLIACGDANDIGLYRRLRELGVDEYLVKPVADDDLARAMVRALAAPAAEASARAASGTRGPVVAFLGARGGVGATTLAVNAAWLAARDHGRRTVLVDLDLQFGTAALALDVDPGRGFREALESPDRIDGLFVERAVVRASDRLAILAAEGVLGGMPATDAEALEGILGILRESFELVVVDLPRGVVAGSARVLRAVDRVVIVSDLSLAGMRDTLRLLEYVGSAAPAAVIDVLANRAGDTARGEMAKADFERNVGVTLAGVVPDDRRGADRGARDGRPMAAVARRGRAVSALAKFIERVVDRNGAKPAPAWRRLLGGKR